MRKGIFYSFVALLITLVAFSVPTGRANAQTPSMDIFVADTADQCAGTPQCFFNDDPDTPQAVALNKAITFARNNALGGARIHIISAYNIKTNTVTIDFPVNIIGEVGGWLGTSSSDCSQPMLLITSDVTIRNLTITDGSCSMPSRDLLIIQSPFTVTIENSTLEFGKNAITHKDSLGNLIVRYSEIKNNAGYALLSENTEVTSRLQLTANNIINNGTGPQVICQNNNEANHNFWGEGILPSQSAQGCGTDNLLRLGAPIASAATGTQATLLTLTPSYPANDFHGIAAKSDFSAKLYVVNHANIMPFTDNAVADLTACGNYFDIFLAEDSQPTALTLRFAYAGNSACEQSIQSISLCGSGSVEKYPLMWMDPKTMITGGWDHTGATPQGEAGDIYSGQVVRCNLLAKTIEVELDNDGRPNLIYDLAFTPFVVGFETTAITVLRAVEGDDVVQVSWTTSSENNTIGFKVYRSTSNSGPWDMVGQTVPSTGGSLSGRSYSMEDAGTTQAVSYYYLLEVIGDDGSVQNTVGPVRLSRTPATNTPRPSATTRPTSTRIPTRTPTAFRTATNSFRTPMPTQFTATLVPTEEIQITDTPALPPFVKPTNLQSTETKRPTVNPGTILDKNGHRPANRNLFLFTAGSLLVVGIVLAYIFLTKKKR